MALESQRAAQELEVHQPRSCASRIYYSGYQAVTAVLLYRGFVPPDGREAWNHDVTPKLILEQLKPVIVSEDARKDLARRLGTLYKLRISADYISNDIVDASVVRKAMKDGNFLLKNAAEILPGA